LESFSIALLIYIDIGCYLNHNDNHLFDFAFGNSDSVVVIRSFLEIDHLRLMDEPVDGGFDSDLLDDVDAFDLVSAPVDDGPFEEADNLTDSLIDAVGMVLEDSLEIQHYKLFP
jgi:hypothetical protein